MQQRRKADWFSRTTTTIPSLNRECCGYKTSGKHWNLPSSTKTLLANLVPPRLVVFHLLPIINPFYVDLNFQHVQFLSRLIQLLIRWKSSVSLLGRGRDTSAETVITKPHSRCLWICMMSWCILPHQLRRRLRGRLLKRLVRLIPATMTIRQLFTLIQL